MIIDQISIASKLKLFQNGQLDEFSDRLSYKFSSFIFYGITAVILFKQYFQQSISCYYATDPGGSHLINYIESYCWVEGVIPISFNGTLPTIEKEWENIMKYKIVYYQWIPFVLFAQGVLCYVPHIFWRLFHSYDSNKDFQHIIARASQVTEYEDEERKNEVIRLAKALEKMLFRKRTDENASVIGTKIQAWKSYILVLHKRGIPLIIFYISIKIIYFLNAVGQMALMHSFLNLDNKNYMFFGTKILYDITNGKDWQVSLVFPRIGYCFAKLRHLGSVNYIVAQCALPINMLNEKIYIFLWFWMLFLTVSTLLSLVIWTIRALLNKNKTDFLKMYLQLSGDYSNKELNTRKIKGFEDYFLQHDGMFLLRMMATSAGDLITAEVVSQLWKIYTPKYEESNLNLEKLENCLLKRQRSSNAKESSRRVSF